MTDIDQTIRDLFKGGSVLFAGQVFELGISFLAVLLVAPYLGREGFGAVSIGVTVLSATLPFILLGLPAGVGRFLPRYEERARRRGVLVSALQIAGPLALLVGVVLYLSADLVADLIFNDPAVGSVLAVFAVAVPFAMMMEYGIGGVKGLKQSLPKVAVRNVLFPTTRLAAVLVGVHLGFDARGIAWAYVLPYILSGVAAMVYVVRRTPLLAGIESPSMHRELLTFSIPLVASGAMMQVLRNLDTFLLGIFPSATTGDIGVYNVVYPVAMLPTFVLSSFGFIFVPVISELHADRRDDEMRRLYRITTKWVLLGTLPIALPILVFPEAVIERTFGADFVGGAAALSILTFAYLATAAAGPNSELLTSIGRTRLILYDNTAAAGLNLVLNVVLIPRYGIVGAAAATASSYVMMNLLYSYQLYAETDSHPLTGALLKPTAVALLLIVGIQWVTDHYLDPGLVGITLIYAGFLVVYGVSILATGAIEREEVMLVLDFEDRFGVDLGPLKDLAKRLM